MKVVLKLSEEELDGTETFSFDKESMILSICNKNGNKLYKVKEHYGSYILIDGDKKIICNKIAKNYS